MDERVKLSAIVEGMDLLTEQMSAYLSKETGEVVTVMDEEFRAAEENDDTLKELYGIEEDGIELAVDVLENEGVKYIALPSKFDIHEWAIMKAFCLSIEDRSVSGALLDGIHGKGAFRYFKECIYRFGLADQWYEYRGAALKEIAVKWCQENNIEFQDD
jgi:hypothetical protein